MVQRYMGIDRYWRFIAFDECGGMPSFHVQTPDNQRTEFHYSMGMMKVFGMGVSHYLEKRNGYYSEQNGDHCIDCLIEVDRLVR
jgi:hypothetical protein